MPVVAQSKRWAAPCRGDLLGTTNGFRDPGQMAAPRAQTCGPERDRRSLGPFSYALNLTPGAGPHTLVARALDAADRTVSRPVHSCVPRAQITGLRQRSPAVGTGIRIATGLRRDLMLDKLRDANPDAWWLSADAIGAHSYVCHVRRLSTSNESFVVALEGSKKQ